MDLTDTITPKSDQLNAEDLLSGPRTVTITEVRRGASPEQPVDVVLAEFGPGRPFKPSKTVRRILVLAWGKEAAEYVGRRMTLYREPSIKFGGQAVGGIRISHLSHIDKPLRAVLAETKGKRAEHLVQPLADEPKPATDGITADQSKALFAALNDNELGARDDALAYIAGLIGRDVASTKELTKAEAQKVIDSLPTPPEGDDK